MRRRQLPEGDELFLDHVGWFVPDIEGCAAAFERLGFTVSPVNTHFNGRPDGGLEPAGTANRLITLGLGYLEVLGAVADTPLARQLETARARYTGLHLIALAHADLAAEERRLAAAGFALQPLVRLRRPAMTAEGPREARFSVLRATPEAMAEGRVQMLTHGTPELVWLPGAPTHPNRAAALTDLLIVQPDAAAAAERWSRFTGRAPVVRADGLIVLPLERGRVSLCDAGKAARLLPGLALPPLPFCAAAALESDDLDATRAALSERGVSPIAQGEGILAVGPADALGAVVLFHAAGIAHPWARLRGLK